VRAMKSAMTAAAASTSGRPSNSSAADASSPRGACCCDMVLCRGGMMVLRRNFFQGAYNGRRQVEGWMLVLFVRLCGDALRWSKLCGVWGGGGDVRGGVDVAGGRWPRCCCRRRVLELGGCARKRLRGCVTGLRGCLASWCEISAWV
jgi:hypothetical protein